MTDMFNMAQTNMNVLKKTNAVKEIWKLKNKVILTE